MLIYLLVVTLTGLPAGFQDLPEFRHPTLTEAVVTHSFAVAYHDRVDAELALQRIRTRWADAFQVSITAEVYEVCVPAPETLPCAGAARWIRRAPPAGVGP